MRAVSLWDRRYPTQRARFADDVGLRTAQCLEKLGRAREAADAYQRFLRDYQRARGGAHPDAWHLGELARRLRAPSLTSQPGPAPVEPRRRRRAWLVGALGVGVAALASEGLAVGFTVKANGLYNDTGEYSTARGVAIGGHLAAGLMAVACGVLSYVYYASVRGAETPKSRRVLGPARAGLSVEF